MKSNDFKFLMYANIKTHFIHVSTLFSQKDMHLNRFHPGAGGDVGFLNFEALFDIFELGIQHIWIQHPFIPLEIMC